MSALKNIVDWNCGMGLLYGGLGWWVSCWIGEKVFSMIVFVGKEAGFGFGLHREGFIIWVS